MSARKKQLAGSPAAGEPAYLAVGRIRRPHGVMGGVLVDLYTDFPERLKPGKNVYCGKSYQPLKISQRQSLPHSLLLSFDGINSPEEAKTLSNHTLFVPVADIPVLPKGYYYHHEIVGLVVETDAGIVLGSIVDILQTGANDIYVVKGGREEYLLPAIKEVILDIDFESEKILVHLLPGLIERNLDQND